MTKQKKTLKKLRNTILSRGLALSKITLQTGALAAKENIQKVLNSKAAESIKKRTLLKQVEIVTNELGELKGSLMKVGQQLSVYGEHFLPPEAIEVLKTLQSNSPSIDWSIMKKTLDKELGPKKLSELEIDKDPIASASLGQVYKARYKEQDIVLKVQYPNLSSVIDADLKALKKLLGLLSFLPKDGPIEHIFIEVKEMLLQELNYSAELESLTQIRESLKNDSCFIIPNPIKEFSTSRVLTMSYEPSLRLDSIEAQRLPQELRNYLAEKFLELYFRELFEFGIVQTDPHLGNYGVHMPPNEKPKLVLYDYGAVKKVSPDFFEAYKKIIFGSIQKDRITLLKGAKILGLVKENDPQELVEQYIDLCFMFTEPFWKGDYSSSNCPPGFDKAGNYNYAQSDLPHRIASAGKSIVFRFKFRTPPKELLFLDRKMGGTFTVLAALRAKINGRKIFDKVLESYQTQVVTKV